VRHILSERNIGVLARTARSRVLLAFDFDGTLAPIVEHRGRAAMRDRTRTLLARVCGVYPCAVISGRSHDDVCSRLRGVGVKYVVGNHGLEPGARLDEFAREVAHARPVLERAFRRAAGVEIEDKHYSLAVHYRRARRKRDARSTIHGALAALAVPMRAIPGKLVVNIVPARAPNKGDALMQLRSKEGADTALYIGDDVTDEDVFDLDQPGRLLTIRVGASKSSTAAYFVRDQRETDVLLTKLLGFKKETGGR
jgi:trehalose 6-phosphate phosphatase